MNKADLVAFALNQIELDMEDRGSDDDMDVLQCQIDLVDYALNSGDKAKFVHDDDEGAEFTDNELKRYGKVLADFEADGIPWPDGEAPRLENPSRTYVVQRGDGKYLGDGDYWEPEGSGTGAVEWFDDVTDEPVHRFNQPEPAASWAAEFGGSVVWFDVPVATRNPDDRSRDMWTKKFKPEMEQSAVDILSKHLKGQITHGWDRSHPEIQGTSRSDDAVLRMVASSFRALRKHDVEPDYDGVAASVIGKTGADAAWVSGMVDRLRGLVETPLASRRSNPGVEHADLPLAERHFTMWHQKNPHELLEATVQFPAQVACVGEATQTCYGSDKWHKDGDFEEYFHDHDGGVKVYMASDDGDVDTRRILHVRSLDGELAMPILAKTREITYRMADGRKRTLRFTDAPMLCCTPDKKTLAIFSSKLGPILIRGGKMLVTKRGIVG